jgi:hypothetical protein
MKPTIEDKLYQELLGKNYQQAIETIRNIPEETQESFYYKGKVYGFLSTPSGTVEDTYYFLNGFRLQEQTDDVACINYSTTMYLDHTLKKDASARDGLNLETNIVESPHFLYFVKGFIDYAEDICESLEFYWDLTNQR